MPDFDRRPWSTRLARSLRHNMTPEEALVWSHLHRGCAWRFRRQEPIGPYICDFVCYPKRLVVEVDGAQHVEDPTEAARDQARDSYLHRVGFAVLRFTNTQVLGDLEMVLDTIEATLRARPDLHRNREPRQSQC
jgi:very-short-patch-repair endonuclease